MPPRNQEQQVTAGERPAEFSTAAPDGKPRQREFRPDIQGLRALAVGMVVFYHLYPSLMTGGFAGVDVFFVISGFLITGHMLREYRKTGRIGLLEFWGRRAKRLVPAAALVLTVTWVASRLRAARDAAGGHRRPDQGERALLRELAARLERGRLPQVGQRGEPGAALLVAVRRGAVLPGLAVPVRPRGARGAHRAAAARHCQGRRRAGAARPRAPRAHPAGGRGGRRARSATRSTTRGSTRRAPTS